MPTLRATNRVCRHGTGIRRCAGLSHRSLPSAALLVALFVLLLGPGTGVMHGLHLAHAGEHHDADECALCQQVAVGSDYVPDTAPVAILAGHLSVLRRAIPATDCERIHAPVPILPRAPPSMARAKAA